MRGFNFRGKQLSRSGGAWRWECAGDSPRKYSRCCVIRSFGFEVVDDDVCFEMNEVFGGWEVLLKFRYWREVYHLDG